MSETNPILAEGVVSATDVPDGDHAAGLSAALADALGQVDENDVQDPDQRWVIRFALQLEPGGSAKVTSYHAIIRDPVADIDW